VTVPVTAGCSKSIPRHYTFLTELPTAAARTSVPLEVSRLMPTATAVAPDARFAPVSQGALGGLSTAPALALNPARVLSPKNKAAPLATAPPRRVTRSRLLMEPLDTWFETSVPLRSSLALASVPTEEASARRAEAAALWRALNLPPQEVVQLTQRLAGLEAEATQLKTQNTQGLAMATALRQQLETAEQERVPVVVAYSLAGLLALALGMAAWAWVRVRRTARSAAAPWHDGAAFHAEPAVEAVPAVAERSEPSGPIETVPQAPMARPDTAAPLPPTPSSVDPLLSPVSVAPPPRFQAPAAIAPEYDFVAPGLALVDGPQRGISPAIVSPEEVFDVQQEAEFFVSVGEHNQAIHALQEHIAQHTRTSPLAYLELLRIYHMLSRSQDFHRLRSDFMRYFNARVADFSQFNRPTKTLENYPEALAVIEAEWPTDAVVALLETYLFRGEDPVAAGPFEQAAYEDLMLLLAIAKTTPASARGVSGNRLRTTPHSVSSAPVEPEEAVLLPPGMAALLQNPVQLLPGTPFSASGPDTAGTVPTLMPPPEPSPVFGKAALELDLDFFDAAEFNRAIPAEPLVPKSSEFRADPSLLADIQLLPLGLDTGLPGSKPEGA
ncbi:MAG: hypothetical protein PHI55_14830, partial [Burkholderiaceae bacterium]|nr:hypothetical protein [Burkholderiaceae bacterium]